MGHIEALRLCIEALRYHTELTRPLKQTNAAIAAAEAALAAAQEPVAWMDPEWPIHGAVSAEDSFLGPEDRPHPSCGWVPVYTAPPDYAAVVSERDKLREALEFMVELRRTGRLLDAEGWGFIQEALK